MAELEAILSGQASTEVETTGEPEIEVAAPAAAAPPAEPPKESSKPPHDYVPRAALHDERRKRQDLEARLKAMESKETPEPKVGLLDDPDKWEQQLDARVQKEVERVRAESQGALLNFLEAQAREKHPDYDEVVAVFAEQAKQFPSLVQEALASSNPVQYAFDSGRKLKLLAEAGDLDALLDRERKKAREEALAERQQEPPESLTEISGARSAPSRKYAGPKPLGEMLPKI